MSAIHNLPPQPTSFIGRVEELIEITTLLADPACRLLTVLGPGGIGKTRLAIQAAVKKQADFRDGAYFVSLQPVQSTDHLVSAIADALALSLRGQADPRLQLLDHFRDREMLLLWDNFEHLLAEPGSILLLGDILQAAPATNFLLTSREVLNLQEEWLYPVRSMLFPEGADAERPEAYGAVQLFVERALRFRRDFSLVDEKADVIRICQLVEGMPLALEIAASWTKTLSCRVIADEIERNIDFLATNLRNIPERHQSMQAVFNHSWQLLTEKERTVFKRLSVFRGGFRREAAERVAGASLAILSTLVDKSLLRSEPSGRYRFHELLRQYGAEQLVRSAEDVAQVYDLHCAYYADFLFARRKDMSSGRQLEATAEVAAELDNVRAGWQWALTGAKPEEISKSAHTLSLFYQFKSRYREGLDTLEMGAHSLSREDGTRQQKQARAMALVDGGWFAIRLGWLDKAETMLEEGRDIYAGLGIPPPPGHATDPGIALGIVASVRGNYQEAARLGKEALQVSQSQHHRENLPFAHYLLARASFSQGDYEAAQQHARQACALVEETDDRWFMAYCLNELGHIAGALGNYAEARQHYQTSYTIREAFDDPEGMAVALNHLGKVALLQKEYSEARKLYEQAMALYREINDRGGLATSLNGVGMVACAQGACREAQPHFRQALQVAADIQFIPLILTILAGVGELLLQTGPQGRGVELLVFAGSHPASDRETKDRALRSLDGARSQVSPDLFEAAVRRGRESELSALVSALRAELALPTDYAGYEAQTILGKEEAVASSSPAGGDSSQIDQPLVEPLTPRELEVLRLIAEGMTNQQMAEALIISTGTVKWYTSQIYGKLNVSSRTQAVARARELKILN